MKKILILFGFIALSACGNGPSSSQGMRDSLKSYEASERCFSNKGSNKPAYCLYGNGNIHRCFLQSSCWEGSLSGKLNQRFRWQAERIYLREYYIEGGSLVKYSCHEGAYMQCKSKPEKTVLYPTKSRQEVLESKEKFDNYFDSGNVKRKSKDYQGAIADYSKAIAIDPQYVDAYYERALAKHGLEDYQGAIADYSKAIEIDPDDLRSYNFRGRVKAGLKDFQGAIADFSKTIEINPQFNQPYFYRGVVKVELKDYQGAIADYNKAIEIDPQYALAYAGRADLKYRLGDQQGSCPDWKKAVSFGLQAASQYLNSEEGEWCRNMK